LYFGVRFLQISPIFVETNHKKDKFMRKLSFIFATLLLVVTMHAQDLKVIKLNSPDKNRGCSVMKALSDRHSDREYADKELSLQDLSDLLWAANGINRPDGKRTAPSALNKQDIDIYVIMKEGAYLYDTKTACNLLLKEITGLLLPAVRILSNRLQSVWYSSPIFHASETLPIIPS
jgi:hypothetical protein